MIFAVISSLKSAVFDVLAADLLVLDAIVISPPCEFFLLPPLWLLLRLLPLLVVFNLAETIPSKKNGAAGDPAVREKLGLPVKTQLGGFSTAFQDRARSKSRRHRL